jgi:hypothetical protein
MLTVSEHEKAHAEGHNSFSYHIELEVINVNIAYDYVAQFVSFETCFFTALAGMPSNIIHESRLGYDAPRRLRIL